MIYITLEIRYLNFSSLTRGHANIRAKVAKTKLESPMCTFGSRNVRELCE